MTGIDDLARMIRQESEAKAAAMGEPETPRLTISELAEKAVEIKRLAVLATTMVPVKKETPRLSRKDLSAVRDWMARIKTAAEDLETRLADMDIDVSEDGLTYKFTDIDLDIVSALTNLGVARGKAEDSVRSMRKFRPDLDFTDGFRMALDLTRK